MSEKRDQIKQAVALSYDKDIDAAPTVKAKGKGFVAEQLLHKAEEHNIPIHEDTSLMEILTQLEINETIPAELYEVVAEVFAFLYRMDRSTH